jgi:SAM-dependent methyltransferase
MKSSSEVKLNLGCGLQCPAGWINIDSSIGARLSKFPILSRVLHAVIPKSWGILPNVNWPANVKWMDITKRFCFADNSVDVIYTSHTIEHLTYDEAAFVFKECFRVLKMGGLIRVIVPDLSVMVNSYINNRTQAPHLAAKKLLDDTFYFEIPIPKGFLQLLKFHFRKKNNHYFLYDHEGLAHQLALAGFIDTVSCKCNESKIANIDNIDIESRFQGAICLESARP